MVLLTTSLALGLGLLISLLLEQGLHPRPLLPTQRPVSTLFIHVGTWLMLFSGLLALTLRPWFATGLVTALLVLLILVNHAKYQSLREPFLFQDFDYFTDAIKHPRLYLPFFGILRTLAATLGFSLAVIAGVVLEPPLTKTLSWPIVLLANLSLLSLGFMMLKQGLRTCPVVSFNPYQDLTTLGQLSFFWQYALAEWNTRINPDVSPFQPTTNPAPSGLTPPNIVVIQSESFFDPRALSAQIKPDVLKHFDAINQQAYAWGKLNVPAFGANTVRTECAFLTSTRPEDLGVHQFNPYRSLAKHAIPNLVAHLKQQGYRTVCIHPYPSTFYQRHLVFPKMGFDDFIDISGFTAEQKQGQYISDLAVTERIIQLLTEQTANNHTQPLFIFVITMENHGPLHLEQLPNEHSCQYIDGTLPPCGDDLIVYLNHLAHADEMIHQLTDYLRTQDAQQQPGVLCWYGDHVPIMPNIYSLFGESDGDTDYFIWHSSNQGRYPPAPAQTIAIHELAQRLLSCCSHPNHYTQAF
ncbi:LTA synthase family protein [Methylocucumis oryzae]|uniref:Sulfatase N-terminal domain-containing protein n=1 Tax=Methylocucumis oryzae TaxID=1632867 RepID=A0A0F3IFI0_9GAMM|nr:LTA synthase family protein [Methylocucumis oryzae]KJV05521.1 hypothetical protein VZ94_17570 [Methylocucumis oryzae]